MSLEHVMSSLLQALDDRRQDHANQAGRQALDIAAFDLPLELGTMAVLA